MMRKTYWEYLRIPYADDDALNKLGTKGWELVSTTGALFFKRQIDLDTASKRRDT